METREKYSITVCGREELLARRGFDFIVFRADDTGRIISGFPNSMLQCGGESVYTCCFSGDGGREYLHKMLSGYSRSPFMMNTDRGCALIIRSMVPATNLCAALILEASADCMKSLAASGALDMVVLPPEPCGKTNFKNDYDPHEAEIAAKAYGYARGGFYGFGSDSVIPGSIESLQKASEIVRCLAYMACCACTCSADERVYNIWPFGVNRKFDGDIFTAFALMSLLACGRIGMRREARLKYSIIYGEPVIDIETEIFEEESCMPEIDECRRIADRRRLFFEYSFNKKPDGNIFKIRFSPIRYDWSVLGVKNGSVQISD
jgi:hypothetical protein